MGGTIKGKYEKELGMKEESYLEKCDWVCVLKNKKELKKEKYKVEN